MIDEQTVWDDIWPIVERLIAATLAEDPQAIRPLLLPGGQAADALDLYGFVVFDILLKTILGRERLGLVRAIEADGGQAIFIEYAWPDPAAGRGYTAVDVVAVRLERAAGGWLVDEINPAAVDLPLNSARAAGILAGTQAMSEAGKLPAEPWVLPVALYAGALQLPLAPGAAADAVEAALLPGLQARSFGLRPQLFGRRLWRDFVAAARPELDRPAVWAAAVEFIIGEQSGREQTQAAVGRAYRAPLGGVAGRVKHITRALAITGRDDRYSDFVTTEIVYNTESNPKR